MLGGRRGRSAWLLAALAGPALLAAGAGPAVPDPHAAPSAAQRAAASDVAPASRAEVAAALARLIVADMPVAERAATVVMGHIGGTDARALRSYVDEGSLGGFILMGSNVPGEERALRRLTDAVDGPEGALPPLIAVDEEGGTVTRLPWDDALAGAALQGRDPSEAEEAFAERGRLLERAGIAVNFGIVADVGTPASGFIRPRTLGADPTAASQRVAAAVAGERGRAFSTLKHFPGHGAAPGDSHATIPQTEMPLDEWRSEHAPPFAAGIEAGAELVMTGHLRFTAVDGAPASLSPEWYRILREELGFDGVAITDDLGMLLASGDARYADPVRNAVDAVAAGADMTLMVAGSDRATAAEMAAGIASAAEGGELDPRRLEEAATRVVTLRVLASGLLDGPAFD
jgi:beta-N-acetylhexosaminidase